MQGPILLHKGCNGKGSSPWPWGERGYRTRRRVSSSGHAHRRGWAPSGLHGGRGSPLRE